MNKLLTILVSLLIVHSVCAQEAVETYARGENTYIRFTKESFDSTKNYTVISFYPEGKHRAVIPEVMKAADVVDCEWKTQEDLNKTLSKYQIKAYIHSGNLIRLESPDYAVNTTSEYAYLVLLGNKIQLVCCGQDCGNRLSGFFSFTK